MDTYKDSINDFNQKIPKRTKFCKKQGERAQLGGDKAGKTKRKLMILRGKC